MITAAIDVGTNSTRLLIVNYQNGDYTVLQQKKITTRIGEGVQGIARLVQALNNFKKVIKKHRVKKINIAGTSFFRDLKNSKKLVNEVYEKTGFKINIISGREEARLVYEGVSFDFDQKQILIIDIGGGSTEFIWKQNKKINYKSIDMGAVRFTLKYIDNPEKPLPDNEYKKIKQSTYKLLKEKIPEKMYNFKTIGVGGTITTLGAIEQKLVKYQPEKIHKYQLTADNINKILNVLSKNNLEKRKKIKGLEPKRADIIIAGVIILKTIIDYFNLNKIFISEKDILWGLIKRNYQ